MAQYSSREVSLSFGGVPIQGFGDGTMVSWSYDSDFTTDTIGVDGIVTASKTNDYRATVTFTLKETSVSNAVLTTFAASRQKGTGSIGVAPLALVNTLTGEKLFAAEAWVVSYPDGEFGSEATDREWEIRCARLEYTHAGNLT